MAHAGLERSERIAEGAERLALLVQLVLGCGIFGVGGANGGLEVVFLGDIWEDALEKEKRSRRRLANQELGHGRWTRTGPRALSAAGLAVRMPR